LIVGGDRRFMESLAGSVTAGDSVEVVDMGTDAAVAAERASVLGADVVVIEVDTLEPASIEATRALDALEPRPMVVMLAQPASVGLRRAAETVRADAYVATDHATDVMQIVLGLVSQPAQRPS